MDEVTKRNEISAFWKRHIWNEMDARKKAGLDHPSLMIWFSGALYMAAVADLITRDDQKVLEMRLEEMLR